MQQEFDSIPTADLALSPSFSLGTALAWLGHDCSGGCPGVARDWRSTVWFAHQPGTRTQIRTLVEVDFLDSAWSATYVGELLSAVNRCVARDLIRVSERARHPAGLFD